MAIQLIMLNKVCIWVQLFILILLVKNIDSAVNDLFMRTKNLIADLPFPLLYYIDYVTN